MLQLGEGTLQYEIGLGRMSFVSDSNLQNCLVEYLTDWAFSSSEHFYRQVDPGIGLLQEEKA